MLVNLWGGGLGAGCRVGRVLGEGSCHSAEATGKRHDCTVHESSPKWPHRTVQCVWRPEKQKDITQIHNTPSSNVDQLQSTYHSTIKNLIQSFGTSFFFFFFVYIKSTFIVEAAKTMSAPKWFIWLSNQFSLLRKVHRASNVEICDLNNCIYTCDKKPILDFELRVIINQQNREHSARQNQC